MATHGVSMGTVLQSAITSLAPEDQIQLTVSLTKYLTNQGVLDAKVLECLNKAVGN